MTTNRRCIVCGRDLDDADRRTCVRCLGAVRRALIDVEALYALLPDEIEGRAGAASPMDVSGVRGDDEMPIPGGEALVMLAGGAVSYTYGRRLLAAVDDSHADDEWESDPPAVLNDLAGYEDIWRDERGEGRGPSSTMSGVVTYLTRRLTWAAQEWLAFDEFATFVHRVRARLERVVHAGHAVEKGAPCPYCGSRIIRRYIDPDPCPDVWVDPLGYGIPLGYGVYLAPCPHDEDTGHDQGGRREDWVCSSRDCGRLFDDDQHRFAIWQAHLLDDEAS